MSNLARDTKGDPEKNHLLKNVGARRLELPTLPTLLGRDTLAN